MLLWKQRGNRRLGRGRGRNTTQTFMEIQCPWVAGIAPETTARMLLASNDILKKGRCLSYESLGRAGICELTAIFSFPVSQWQRTNSKKHQSDLGFSISKVLLQVGHTDAKEKIKAICHRAGQILKVDTANNRKPASHNAWTVTNKQAGTK